MLTHNTWPATLIGLSAIFWQANGRAAEYTLDPSRTLVSFEMRSLGTTQRGEFNRATGTVVLDVAQERGAIDIVIDARSLTANTAATTKLVRGPSLLNTQTYPEIAYQAQHIVFSEGKPTRIEGELTLLGVTRPVALYVTDYACTGESIERCTVAATAYLKRSEFGMTRYLMFASDEVKLAIRAEAQTTDAPPSQS